jgi:hypothetical protein
VSQETRGTTQTNERVVQRPDTGLEGGTIASEDQVNLMTPGRFSITMAVLAAGLPLSLSGCAGPAPTQSSTSTQSEEHRAEPAEARLEGSDIFAKLRSLDESAVPTSPAPSSVECGPHSDQGVEFHWAVQGAAAEDPRGYAARAVTVLKAAGFSTNRTTSELNDERPLYVIGGESSSGAQVALSASALNTVLQVSSACADGEATDFG